jgi:hypothetical protein
MKAKKGLSAKLASAGDGWGNDDEWGAGSTVAATKPKPAAAASATSDAAAKRAALKAKLERKRQLAANQTSSESSACTTKPLARPSAASKPIRVPKPSQAKSAASKKGDDDWDSW